MSVAYRGIRTCYAVVAMLCAVRPNGAIDYETEVEEDDEDAERAPRIWTLPVGRLNHSELESLTDDAWKNAVEDHSSGACVLERFIGFYSRREPKGS